MLSLGGRPIWLYRGWVDMRCQVDRLAQLVEHHVQRDPYSGEVFVFLGRDRRRVKLLVWDTSGFWLASKRLEQGLYASPVVFDGPECRTVLALSPAEMAMILERNLAASGDFLATTASHYRRTEKSI